MCISQPFNSGHRAVLRRRLGASKCGWCTRGAARSTRNVKTPANRPRRGFASATRMFWSLPLTRSRWKSTIRKKPAFPRPWISNGQRTARTAPLYIVQARPETVASRRKRRQPSKTTLQSTGHGRSPRAGDRREDRDRSHSCHRTSSASCEPSSRARFWSPTATRPDWEPVMKTAGAIVTNRGGRTCHAAIVARELGVPAVVGTEDSTEKRRPAMTVTVSCAEGDIGTVYAGQPALRSRARIEPSTLERPRTKIMVNLGNPDLAFQTAMMPNDGVGLARMEFIINEHIGIHPMALVAAGKSQVSESAPRRSSDDQPLCIPSRLFHAASLRRRGHHRRGVLSEARDRSPVRLQDQRICEPDRRR